MTPAKIPIGRVMRIDKAASDSVTGSRSPIAERTLWLSIRDEPKLPCSRWTNQMPSCSISGLSTEIVPHRGNRFWGSLIACDHDSGVAWQVGDEEKGEHGHDQDDRKGPAKFGQRSAETFQVGAAASCETRKVRSSKRVRFSSPRLMPARYPRVAEFRGSRTDPGASSHRPTTGQRQRS